MSDCRVLLRTAISALESVRRGIDEPFITSDGTAEGCHGNVFGVGSTVMGDPACERRGLVRTSDNMTHVSTALRAYFFGKRKDGN